MKLRTPLWQRLRRDEIGAARDAGAVVLIPAGSTEQHGAHLPVYCDYLCATSVCQRAAEMAGEADVPVLVVPGIWSGYSPHHMDFPGAITLSGETFEALVTEVCLSVMHHGFKRVVLVNGHGGNSSLLSVVAAKLTTSGRPVALTGWFNLPREDWESVLEGELKGVGHACEGETSMCLRLSGDDVDMTRARSDYTWPIFAGMDRTVFTDYGVGMAAVHGGWTSGVYGDAELGTAEKGQRIFDIASRRLSDFCRRYHQISLDSIPVSYDQL